MYQEISQSGQGLNAAVRDNFLSFLSGRRTRALKRNECISKKVSLHMRPVTFLQNQNFHQMRLVSSGIEIKSTTL
jgi:hypothetical protein